MSYSVFNTSETSSNASQRCYASTATTAQTQELASWIHDNGGHVEDVVVAKHDSQGQTLMSSRHIKKGQTLIALPRVCQLHAFSADPGLQQLIDRVPSTLWPARLALPLIAERVKGSSSKFDVYLRSLPAGIPGLPLFFGPQDMSQLQYPPLVQQITMRCRWLIKFAAEDLPQAPASAFGGQAVDANLLGWGMGCASSRAFKISGEQPSMLPMIDLCNHSFKPNCELRGASDGTASLVAIQDIPKDTAIDISYGNLSNTMLLQDYGFIMKDNPHDAVDMAVSAQQIQVAQVLGGVAMNMEPLPWQQALLNNLGAGGAGLNAPLRRSGSMFDWQLVAAVRILCAETEKDLKFKNFPQLGDLSRAQKPDIERKTLTTLAAMCAQLIAVMGTKLEDDKQLIQSSELSANTQLAIRYRMEMKLLIQAALALALNKLKTVRA